MTGTKYETADAKAQRMEDIVRRVEALPGVQAAFASKLIPLGDGGGTSPVVIDGKPVDPGKEPSVGFVGTTPAPAPDAEHCTRSGAPVSAAENESKAAVALINQSMATRMWGDEDPVGRRFRPADAGAEWLTVSQGDRQLQPLRPECKFPICRRRTASVRI